MTASTQFRVALTADFYDAAGKLRYDDIGLNLLAAHPRFELTRFAELRPVIEPQQFAGVNGAITLGFSTRSIITPRSSSKSLPPGYQAERMPSPHMPGDHKIGLPWLREDLSLRRRQEGARRSDSWQNVNGTSSLPVLA